MNKIPGYPLQIRLLIYIFLGDKAPNPVNPSSIKNEIKKAAQMSGSILIKWFKDYLPSSIFLFNSANASMSPRVDLSSLLEEEDTFLEEDSLTFFFSSSLKIPV